MECLKHSDCGTGFCPNGTCQKPKAGDVCAHYGGIQVQGSCPSGLFCDYVAKRCKPGDFERPATFASCRADDDCDSNMFCGSGTCEFKGFLGFRCEKGRCEDGSECYKDGCVSRCYNDSNCEYREQCVQSPTKGFRMCIPKPKKEKPQPQPEPEPEPQPKPQPQPEPQPQPQDKDTYMPPDYYKQNLLSAVAIFCILIGVIIVIILFVKRSKRKSITNASAPFSGPSSPSMPHYSSTPGYQQPMAYQAQYTDAQPPQYPEPPPAYQFVEKSQ